MKPLSILITDDIPENRMYISQLLSAVIKKAQTEMAGDGQAAVEAVKAKIKNTGASYDLIIMDYKMPVMNGAEATANIRKVERAAEQSTRSIIITWSTSMSAPYPYADDWLPKMTRSEEIRKVLEQVGLDFE